MWHCITFWWWKKNNDCIVIKVYRCDDREEEYSFQIFIIMFIASVNSCNSAFLCFVISPYVYLASFFVFFFFCKVSNNIPCSLFMFSRILLGKCNGCLYSFFFFGLHDSFLKFGMFLGNKWIGFCLTERKTLKFIY